MTPSRPPRGIDLYRESLGVQALTVNEQTPQDGTLGTVTGYGLKWGSTAEINSASEGHFLESFRAGSLDRTVRDRGSKIRLLYGHGHDSVIGDRPLGPLTLTPDAMGLRYSAPLLDTSYARDLVPALRLGLLGASVRFKAIKDVYNPRPSRTAGNPEAIPTREIVEAALVELSVVTFPAFESSSATLRSSTDAWLLLDMERDAERFAELQRRTEVVAPRPAAPAPASRRSAPRRQPTPSRIKTMTRRDWDYAVLEATYGKRRFSFQKVDPYDFDVDALVRLHNHTRIID